MSRGSGFGSDTNTIEDYRETFVDDTTAGYAQANGNVLVGSRGAGFTNSSDVEEMMANIRNNFNIAARAVSQGSVANTVNNFLTDTAQLATNIMNYSPPSTPVSGALEAWYQGAMQVANTTIRELAANIYSGFDDRYSAPLETLRNGAQRAAAFISQGLQNIKASAASSLDTLQTAWSTIQGLANRYNDWVETVYKPITDLSALPGSTYTYSGEKALIAWDEWIRANRSSVLGSVAWSLWDNSLTANIARARQNITKMVENAISFMGSMVGSAARAAIEKMQNAISVAQTTMETIRDNLREAIRRGQESMEAAYANRSSFNSSVVHAYTGGTYGFSTMLPSGSYAGNRAETTTNVISGNVISIGSYGLSGYASSVGQTGTNSQNTRLDATSLQTIGTGAFAGSGVSQLTTATGLPALISAIGDKAFYQSSITEVSTNSLTNLNSELTFAESKIEKVSLPNVMSMKSQGQFSGCRNLTSVSFGSLNTISAPSEGATIDGYMFAHCENLKEITIPASTIYARRMFYDCKKLERVNFPNCITITGGNEIFKGCSQLKVIDMPRLLHLTGSLFYNGSEGGSRTVDTVYENLTTINVPQLIDIKRAIDSANPTYYSTGGLGFTGAASISCPNLQSIEQNFCFSNSPNLVSLNLPRLTNVTRYMIVHDNALTTLSLPAVTSIVTVGLAQNNFAYTPISNPYGLTSLTLGGTSLSLGDHIVWAHENLSDIYMPNLINIPTLTGETQGIGKLEWAFGTKYVTGNELGWKDGFKIHVPQLVYNLISQKPDDNIWKKYLDTVIVSI